MGKLDDQSAIINMRQIINDIAYKMKDPKWVKDIACADSNRNAEGRNPWESCSLSQGYPGIILFYSKLDLLYPDEGWDAVTHDYLMALHKEMGINRLDDVSLYSGLTGIAFAVMHASRGGQRYTGFLQELNSLAFERIKQFLREGFETFGEVKGTSPFWYDPMSGLSGLAVYLRELRMGETAQCLYKEVMDNLVRLTKEINIDGKKVPGWYIPRQYQFNQDYQTMYPNGNFNCGMSHGIAGPLAVLAGASLEGFEVKGQREAIWDISQWLLSKKRVREEDISWPDIISFEHEVFGETNSNVEFPDAWCYGMPGIAYSLYLAGKVLNEKGLIRETVDAYTSIMKKELTDTSVSGFSFCHGVSGNMHILHKMIRKEEEYFSLYKERLNEYANLLIDRYNPDTPFGFIDYENKELQKPGLLEGSAGICLSILEFIHGADLKWDSPFLLF
ncbi:lantibiotic modifying enzyme [Bacillus thermophilus]|uniref:Lantibiotic modifying enzyme n=1 Tax=Siminovitchia thermophila TaxID=1245522 RepID=A0ABS2R4J1_9BACI|nr:lanthionine synthetase C family protein [Siminovitchia thermophila]MBM7714533.1 lantibiotic modifying enzyme [Siminovitchia thermophila]ONK22598.1 hypothetical protein BLX87_14510 [Bacillus sp. VT-16-64]